MINNKYHLQIGDWGILRKDARNVRTQVFIKEQKIPEIMEWDDDDISSVHVVVYDNDLPIGTARLLSNGNLGRMAVISLYRCLGVATMMLMALLKVAKERGDKEICISAQCAVKQFYMQHGFVVVGDEYLEVDIPHIAMRLSL